MGMMNQPMPMCPQMGMQNQPMPPKNRPFPPRPRPLMGKEDPKMDSPVGKFFGKLFGCKKAPDSDIMKKEPKELAK